MTDFVNQSLPQTAAELAVGTNNGQLCAIATRSYAPGDEIVWLTGTVEARPSRYSVQVGVDQHVEPPMGAGLEEMIDSHTWRYMNHSCDPNSAFRGRTLYAIKPIAAGDEVRFHYAATEYEMAEAFTCRCGAAACVGEVRGYRFLTEEQKRRMAEHVQPHVLAAGQDK